MSTVAAVDCGTNTIKLLIGDLPHVLVRESRMVRLGQGVDRTGRLSDEALARAFAALDVLERGYVPLSVKDFVRDYFSSLDPSGTE